MSKRSLSTKLGPLNLANKVFIGAGAIKTIGDVEYASAIPDLSLILIGSYTEPMRLGNTGKTYYYKDGNSINSIGLQNGGRPYLEENLKEMVRIANNAGKILGISVSGESPEENENLIKFAIDEGVQYFEVNTACGNIINGGTGKSKPIACYDHIIMERMFEVIGDIRFDKTRHYKCFKVGKYLNFSDIDGLAKLHNQYKTFDGIVTSNTEKSKIFDENGDSVIDPDGGYGGLGGKQLKPGAIGQVNKWRSVLSEDMDVIAVGGIFDGRDVMDYENAGAAAMQYTTSYLENKAPNRSRQAEISALYMNLCFEKV